ncbi:hypothetical protein ROLI_024960 [Roseobacter fucihabitans]|uniref:WYL domain-containing protein n=2 Tax=Roseobacter fucihabitans TaxID=1537242 RepID=A0ABZ2BTQ8_9RHOB|nr:hypothetical protein [Roseobacter litoralis]
MNRFIIDAINNTQTLSFYYDDESRTVEPHCYGCDTQGHEALRAYQINKGWRLFHLAEMGPIQIGPSFTAPRPQYNPNDKHLARIYARL